MFLEVSVDMIEDVKTGLTEGAEGCRDAATLTDAAGQCVEEALRRLIEVSQGTTHSAAQKAVRSAQQCRQRLQEAARLAGEAAEAAREYATVLG